MKKECEKESNEETKDETMLHDIFLVRIKADIKKKTKSRLQKPDKGGDIAKQREFDLAKKKSN